MNEFKRYALKSFLRSVSKEHAGIFPQFAIFQYDIVGNWIQTDGYYEFFYLKFVSDVLFPKLKARRICLDIGANIGNHSVYFADYFEQVKCFEPNLRTYKLLEANALLRDNISTENIGLSNTDGTFQVSFDRRNIGMASLERNDNSTYSQTAEFSVRRLDDVIEIPAGSGVDFIKIDVEGHELKVLEGALETLEAHRPVVVLEVLQEDISLGSSPAIDFLQKNDYPHLYIPLDNSPFAERSKLLARLYKSGHTLLTGKRLNKNFSLQKIDRLEGHTNYPMVICSSYILN